MTAGKVQNAVADKFRKDDTLSEKAKGKQGIDKETFDQHVTDDETEAEADGDENGGVIGVEGVYRHRAWHSESSDDQGKTGEGVGAL